jgi:hypothetical protein
MCLHKMYSELVNASQQTWKNVGVVLTPRSLVILKKLAKLLSPMYLQQLFSACQHQSTLVQQPEDDQGMVGYHMHIAPKIFIAVLGLALICGG